jgi:hypothetical protein
MVGCLQEKATNISCFGTAGGNARTLAGFPARTVSFLFSFIPAVYFHFSGNFQTVYFPVYFMV